MALMQCSFFSDSIGMSTSLTAIIPQAASSAQIGITAQEAQEKYPVIYLLHGLSDDHSIWLRRTAIERYAAEYNVAIVMPNVHRSFYTNTKTNLKYWDFVSDELIRLSEHFFPISNKREDRFVAGLSMGGYGAMKLGLRCPEKFSYAASLSGALDLDEIFDLWPDNPAEVNSIFGSKEEALNSDEDVFKLLDDAKKSTEQYPKLYQACGTEDFLYQGNVKFKEQAEGSRLDFHYTERPGVHCWDFWDEEIVKVLKWLPLS